MTQLPGDPRGHVSWPGPGRFDSGRGRLIAKGNEAGGFVGEKTAFILLQQILSKIKIARLCPGGNRITYCRSLRAAGAAGIVLDTQLILTRESPLAEDVKRIIARMNGSEPRLFGENTDAPCRLYARPGSPCSKTSEKLLLNRTAP